MGKRKGDLVGLGYEVGSSKLNKTTYGKDAKISL